MERILVAVDQSHPQHEAMTHACSLAKRIQARLYVLFVHKKSCVVTNPARQRLELLVGYARTEGIHVEYTILEGEYEKLIISFIQNNGITLFIHELEHTDIVSFEHTFSVLQSVRHRISCRVEIVNSQKPLKQHTEAGV